MKGELEDKKIKKDLAKEFINETFFKKRLLLDVCQSIKFSQSEISK